MTTIVWDGKELVADSRITYIKAIVDGGVVVKRAGEFDDTMCNTKIVVGGNFTYAGTPVQAIGVSGDVRVLEILIEAAKSSEYGGDFMDPKNYVGDNPLAGKDLNLIFITDTFVGNVVAGYGKTEMDHVEFPRNYTVVCGSFMEKLGKYVNTPLTARMLVSHATHCDKGTGGTLSVWNGNELVHGIKPFNGFKNAWLFLKTMYKFHRQITAMKKAKATA